MKPLDMAFCPASTQAFSNTELNAFYTGQGAVLPRPTPAMDSSDRIMNENRLLKKEFLNTEVEKLKASKVIPAAPTLMSAISQNTEVTQYTQKLNQLVINLRAEYCFYNVRYNFAIRQLITNIANATNANVASGSINTLLDTCVRLNQRLKDLSQMINAITVSISETTKTLNSEINSLNAELKTYFDKLRAQAEILKAEAPTAELRKRMVEYTREKAKATNNLLSLYFFLDVVALGILFYVYKAA